MEALRASRITCIAVALACGTVEQRALAEPVAIGTSASAENSVEVVLAGPAAASVRLSDLIEELLRLEQVAPRFARDSKLALDELLDSTEEPSAGRARIWVTLARSDLALLLFADPSRKQYLVRQVALRSGLDELGCEHIAQVIQSATLALLRGKPGMSQTQMRQAIASVDDALRPEAPSSMTTNPVGAEQLQVPLPATPRPDPVGRVHTYIVGLQLRGRTDAWAEPRIGLGYAAGWTGDALGSRHGPVVQLGLQRLGGTAFALELSLERDFTQAYTGGDVGVRTQTYLVRLGFGANWVLIDGLRVFATFGGGLDIARMSPTSAGDTDVSLRTDQTFASPALRAETGFELAVEAFRLVIGPRVDASLSNTHYDLVRGGQTERLATPWPVTPGIAAMVVWQDS